MIYFVNIGKDNYAWKKKEEILPKEEIIYQLNEDNTEEIFEFMLKNYKLGNLTSSILLNCKYIELDTEKVLELSERALSVSDLLRENIMNIIKYNDKVDKNRVLEFINEYSKTQEENNGLNQKKHN